MCKKFVFIKTNKLRQSQSIIKTLIPHFFEDMLLNFRFHKFFRLSDFIFITFYSFLYKDLNILGDWIIKMIKMINLYNHKLFFSTLQFVLEENQLNFFKLTRIDGFSMHVRGKLGLDGNAKKKRFFIRIGKLNIENKNKKIDYFSTNLKTKSGILGLKLFLSY